MRPYTELGEKIGLCKTCAFSRVIQTVRGSRFYLCHLSETDSRFPKYPPLPVLECDGYRQIGPFASEQRSGKRQRHD